MKITHSITAAILAIAICTIARAEPNETNGWFVGGAWGEADTHYSLSDFDDGSISSGSVDNHEVAWKIFGGYKFSRHFALEGGYVDLENDYDSPTFEGISDGTGSRFVSFPDGPVSVGIAPTGVFVEGVGSLPIAKGFSAFGKLGFLRWDADTTVSDLNGRLETSQQGTDLLVGAGFEYRFKFGLAVRLEWEVFTGVADQDTDLASVGISYTF